MNIQDFRGQWALVTGASSGIGAEFCKQLASLEVNLVLVARRDDNMQLLAAQLQSEHHIRTLVLPYDLAESGCPRALKESVQSKNIKIRLLVNNAAYGPWGSFGKTSAESYEKLCQLVMGTPIALCREFLDDLSSFSGAAIINLSSPAALQPVPYKAAYSAAKTGLHFFSLALYEELKYRNIYVQTLMPGPTQSELDEKGNAYKSALAEERRLPSEIVNASLAAFTKKQPFVTTAKGTYKQRLFTGLFPIKFVLKTVAQMFKPPENR